jgi:hypothetical protein
VVIGGLSESATVTASAIVDGIEIWSLGDAKLPLSSNGQAIIQFKLPAEMSRGEGTLNVIAEDGGTSPIHHIASSYNRQRKKCHCLLVYGK